MNHRTSPPPHRTHSAVLALLVVAAFALSASSGFSADNDRQVASQLNRQIQVTMQYLLYLPKEYDQRESWPVMLFLHGSGERGHDLNAVKIHGPPKLIQAGRDFPMIVVSPQCSAEGRWEPIELHALLDEIQEHYKVDQDRIYVTGLSMGGFGTWTLAASRPNRFAALLPVCGGGEGYIAKRIAKIPTWVFHGAKDGAVPVERSEKMVAALKKEGGTPQLTIYPEAEHDSWTETYANPAIYEWLLQQKRPPQKAP